MKITTLKTLLGSLTVAGALVAFPLSASAAGATTTSSLHIGKNGVVHVVNAEVTSVSGNIINAVTYFKNTLATWAFTTNASTTIRVGTGATTTPSSIQIGDRIGVAGALTSFGSTIGVNATKILDLTAIASLRGTTGTVKTINTSNGTFVMTVGNKDITVQTNASTTWATKATTTLSLANLAVGTKVRVAGRLNPEHTILTASKVSIVPVKKEDDRKDNKGSFHGLKNGQKDKEDRDNSGEHNGFLKLRTGLGLDL